MPRLAAFLTPGSSLDSTLEHVQATEDLGYELVLDNHIAGHDGLVTLVAYAEATSTIQVGTGVYPAFHMSPLALGQLAATVDDLVGGRLVLGIGTSHREVVEGWHRVDFPDSPLTAMRDTLTILRSLFTTGEAHHDGDERSIGGFAFRGLTPRAELPVMIAALGPKMCRLGGELADGVLTWLCNPQYIREVVVPNVAAGAERAGRDPADIDIVPAVPAALTDAPEPAYAALRQQLIVYLSLPFYRSMLRDSGFGDDLAAFDAAMEDGDVDAAADAMSTTMLDTIAGIGDGDRLQAKLEEYRDAGATMPGVGPLTADGTAGPTEVLTAAIGG